MGKRQDIIGIKQVVRIEWYDYALDMLLSDKTSTEIRQQLDRFICERLQKGGYGNRGDQTYIKAVSQIMKSWVSPDPELVEFRNRALQRAKNSKENTRFALHWAVTIAAYPFWHNVAFQVGRLFKLQEVITQDQIRRRCFEVMGERSTVERSSRRVIRSFVNWGVLIDTQDKGCYKKANPRQLYDPILATILFESALYAHQEGRCELGALSNNPSFFAFQLPLMSGDFITQNNDHLTVLRYGINDEIIELKKATSKISRN